MKEKKNSSSVPTPSHAILGEKPRFPVPHEQERRELKGIKKNLISVFCHWSGTPSTQLCPMCLPEPSLSPGLGFQMLQICDCV